jgi:hypothetical protein
MLLRIPTRLLVYVVVRVKGEKGREFLGAGRTLLRMKTKGARLLTVVRRLMCIREERESAILHHLSLRMQFSFHDCLLYRIVASRVSLPMV